MSLKLHSPAFADGQAIPRRYTGDGEDLSPPLSWSGLPPRATRLALVVEDPDAPTTDPWIHWVIYNLPADEQGLVEGIPPVESPPAPPGCLQGKNSWGGVGYRGPAPPKGHGTHRYIFRLFAYQDGANLVPGLDLPALMAAIQGSIVSVAELTGTYHR